MTSLRNLAIQTKKRLFLIGAQPHIKMLYNPNCSSHQHLLQHSNTSRWQTLQSAGDPELSENAWTIRTLNPVSLSRHGYIFNRVSTESETSRRPSVFSRWMCFFFLVFLLGSHFKKKRRRRRRRRNAVAIVPPAAHVQTSARHLPGSVYPRNIKSIYLTHGTSLNLRLVIKCCSLPPLKR